MLAMPAFLLLETALIEIPLYLNVEIRFSTPEYQCVI
jgi:hypothetical protein